MWHKGKMITSCGDAVGQALEQFLSMQSGQEIKSLKIQAAAPEDNPEPESGNRSFIALCPDCGSSIEHLEGCLKCPACGWSKC
ncbi:MAG: ribonucleotide-diphosphate reductase subunit alpha, partial [Candidatus Cloacimonadaceae bacterium]